MLQETQALAKQACCYGQVDTDGLDSSEFLNYSGNLPPVPMHMSTEIE